MLQRLFLSLLALSAIAVFHTPVQAEVDLRVGQLRVSDDRLTIPLTNAGSTTSPVTKLYVGVTDDPGSNRAVQKSGHRTSAGTKQFANHGSAGTSHGEANDHHGRRRPLQDRVGSQ